MKKLNYEKPEIMVYSLSVNEPILAGSQTGGEAGPGESRPGGPDDD